MLNLIIIIIVIIIIIILIILIIIILIIIILIQNESIKVTKSILQKLMNELNYHFQLYRFLNLRLYYLKLKIHCKVKMIHMVYCVYYFKYSTFIFLNTYLIGNSISFLYKSYLLNFNLISLSSKYL